jgi:hypothetical protein
MAMVMTRLRRFGVVGRLALLCVGLWITPAAAQPALGDHQTFQTRNGLLQVSGDRTAQRLTLDGRTLALAPQPRWWVHGAWGLAEADHDWVLVGWHHGGNSCGGAMHLMRVAPGGQVAISPEIGSCEGRILDLRVTPAAVEMDISDRDLAVSHRTHRWDGAAYTVTPHAPPPVAPAGAGEAVTRWIGQHPYRPFEDYAEQARFAAIMPADQVTRLFQLIGPANAAVRRGDWVFGAGCQAHNCNGAGGRWGMRISDGAVVAAIVERGAATRLFGPLAGDPAFQAWLAENPL